jgi:hypothetical protein
MLPSPKICIELGGNSLGIDIDRITRILAFIPRIVWSTDGITKMHDSLLMIPFISSLCSGSIVIENFHHSPIWSHSHWSMKQCPIPMTSSRPRRRHDWPGSIWHDNICSLFMKLMRPRNLMSRWNNMAKEGTWKEKVSFWQEIDNAHR